MNSRLGARFMTIFNAGLMTGHGNAFLICCVPACQRNVDDTNNQQQVAWTAKASNAAQFWGNVVFDAGKKINGRKRYILADTLGLLLTVVVTVASVQNRWRGIAPQGNQEVCAITSPPDS